MEYPSPRFPKNPNTSQTDIKWIKLSELIILFCILILESILLTMQKNIEIIEKHLLAKY